MPKIEIRVDQQRLGDLVTVDEFIAVMEGDIKSIRDVLGRFVVNVDGGYLDPEEGKRTIGKLSINQLKEAAINFTQKANEAAVPNENGAV